MKKWQKRFFFHYIQQSPTFKKKILAKQKRNTKDKVPDMLPHFSCKKNYLFVCLSIYLLHGKNSEVEFATPTWSGPWFSFIIKIINLSYLLGKEVVTLEISAYLIWRNPS